MMNYLKKFESFQTNEEIHKICKQYSITNYTINSNGSIDVNGDVNLTHKIFEKLPLKFNHVIGNFDCHRNKLTTLEGAPLSVSGNFDCSYNNLTTLESAPNSVDGYFKCNNNKLTTLEYAPQSVNGYFYCRFNKLTTLKGSPKSVIDYFDCRNNNLTSLEYGPQSVGGHFRCDSNRLTTLEGAPQFVGGDFKCSFNIELKSLKYLSKNILSEEIRFIYTAVYEIFKVLDNFSLDMIRYVNDLNVIVDDKINLEILNDILYDFGKQPVEKVKGYDNI